MSVDINIYFGNYRTFYINGNMTCIMGLYSSSPNSSVPVNFSGVSVLHDRKVQGDMGWCFRKRVRITQVIRFYLLVTLNLLNESQHSIQQLSRYVTLNYKCYAAEKKQGVIGRHPHWNRNVCFILCSDKFNSCSSSWGFKAWTDWQTSAADVTKKLLCTQALSEEQTFSTISRPLSELVKKKVSIMLMDNLQPPWKMLMRA